MTNDHAVPSVELFGCRIDNLTMNETLDVVDRFIASGEPHQHVVVNVDKLVKADTDPQLKAIINDCALVNVDGMPVVWASRLLRRPLKERIAGVELFEALISRAARTGWRIYLLGARNEVVSGVAHLYTEKYPGLQIVGYRDGYWSALEEEAVVNAITVAQPDILFVAISSPRKEQFLHRHQQRMRVPFAMGVGGSFDVAAGRVSRAPRWVRDSGFEWFHRFLQEPRRMFRRYFVDDLWFFWMLARELMSRGRSPEP